MHILLTNDDGIYSEGIRALYEALKGIGTVTVVAPEAERSAVGHAITLSDPLRVKKVYRGRRFFGYATSGTPADCVKLAIRSLMRKQPDLVVSGINLGPNVGYSVLYSGTVSGATEGALLGIPSFAISLATYKNPDFRVAASFARTLSRKILRNGGLPHGTILNVNVPPVKAGAIRGVAVVFQGSREIMERFDKREDPRKRTYYWLTGETVKPDLTAMTDIEAVRKRHIAVTPLQFNLTDRDFIVPLREWVF